MSHEKTLQTHFDALKLPQVAADFLLSIWNLTQVFDDAADGDQVNRQSLDKAIFDAFVGLHISPFFQQHRQNILPVLANCIMKWQASDFCERNNAIDEKTFVWRSAYYDVVMMVVLLVHGTETQNLAPYVLKMYGEDYQGYLKEFNHV